ncbi:penicillin acylase family protein [bacterium AH-315-P07]|nr:penicillin acylase family protein [bacterium AH-315-P07]
MSKFRSLTILLIAIALSVPVLAEDLPGTGDDEGKTIIYRDTWGIPHIYAPTDTEGLYAQGYAMAEDRPQQLLLNLLAGVGQLSMIAGPDAINNDLRSAMFDHYGVARRRYEEISPKVREHLEAMAAGINHFYDESDKTPAWWKGRKVDAYMLIAFGRLFLYNWSIDEAYEDLDRGGVKAGYDKTSRASNQFAVSPSRTKNGHAILAIDPHLSWSGFSRFWECRIHAGDLHASGVTLPGSPYIGLGHNADLAWAMTTGGPDTADVFELTLKEGDPTKYQYDGEWRELTSKEITLNVRGLGEQKHTLWFSHHGPIIAQRDGKAYAAAVSYADEVNTSQAWYELNYATDYKGAIAAMDTLTVFPQNVMVADTSGNIYYQRTGRVPVRADGFDWSKPVDGSTSKSEWKGIHPASDHLQVLNPSHGWMQNCNIPPDAMMPNSPFQFKDYKPYLFAGPGHTRSRFNGAITGWIGQRGARAIELLSKNKQVTVKDAIDIINDVKPYGAERWVEVLRRASEQIAPVAPAKHYTRALSDLFNWNVELTKGSTGALKYYFWREQMIQENRTLAGLLSNSIDDWYHIVDQRAPKDLGPEIKDHYKWLVDTFISSMQRMRLEHGSMDARFGDHFRVGRGDESWPTGGGSLHESRTLRSVSYTGRNTDYTQWGRGGQTSTQIVELSKPIKSYIYIPQGQSDDPESPHYSDQAEKLFSKRTLKSSWWTPEELQGNIKSRTVVDVKL